MVQHGPGRDHPALFLDGRDVCSLPYVGGVEGLVAKRADIPYRPGQWSPDWVKLKTPEWREAHADRRVRR